MLAQILFLLKVVDFQQNFDGSLKKTLISCTSTQPTLRFLVQRPGWCCLPQLHLRLQLQPCPRFWKDSGTRLERWKE